MAGDGVSGEPEVRPAVTDVTTGADLLRWYWLRTELTDLARQHGVSTGGGKRELADRLVAHLDGVAAPAPPPSRRRVTERLAEPLDRSTVMPVGQPCSQVLRRYLTARIGPSFRFDAAMRAYVGGAPGRTLDDVVAHWHATRDRTGPPDIAPQFELNRFAQRWHAEGLGTRAEALAAWAEHRSRPRDP